MTPGVPGMFQEMSTVAKRNGLQERERVPQQDVRLAHSIGLSSGHMREAPCPRTTSAVRPRAWAAAEASNAPSRARRPSDRHINQPFFCSFTEERTSQRIRQVPVGRDTQVHCRNADMQVSLFGEMLDVPLNIFFPSLSAKKMQDRRHPQTALS